MIMIIIQLSIWSVSGDDRRGEGNTLRPDVFVLQVATR
jgi:hypothetical protein